MTQAASRYGAVISTYVHRTAFRVLAVLAVIDIAILGLFAFAESRFQADPIPSGIIGDVIGFILFMALVGPYVFFVVFGAMMMQHLREQLSSARSAVIPDYSRPHLVVGFVALVGVPTIALAGVLTVFHLLLGAEGNGPSPIGALALLLAFMAACAWFAAFKSPWFALLVPPLALLMTASTTAQRLFSGLIGEAQDKWMWNGIAFALLLIDLALIAALFAYLSRLSRRDPDESRRLRPPPKPVTNSAPAPLRPHRVLASPLLRAWHRRSGMLSPFAPWFVAGALGLLLTFVSAVFQVSDPTDLLRSVLIPTVVPGVVISLIWRERWMNLGYESLYPADRAQFVHELLAATAFSLAELWIATVIAVLPPILINSPYLLRYPIFQVTLIASAAMQFMVFGIMFLSALYRPMLPYVNVITILAQLIPISFAWTEKPELSLRGLLTVAAVEMLIGVAITTFGYASWRRADLA